MSNQPHFFNDFFYHLLWCVSLSVAGSLIFYALKKYARNKLTTPVTNKLLLIFYQILSATKIWLVFIVLFYRINLFFSLFADMPYLFHIIGISAAYLQTGLWISLFINKWIDDFTKEPNKEKFIPRYKNEVFLFVSNSLLWLIIFLLTLDRLGVDITALIAGLGIGGAAIAFSLKNILGDLFASVSITIDKPFVVGDFIVIDNYKGTIENIGLKTTRIRSLDGEEIIFPNSDLLKNPVKNYKRMYERRVIFSLFIVYNSNLEQLINVPEIIKMIIESFSVVRFERAHLKKIGKYSLEYEVVYWVSNPDYLIYMDVQQEINFKILNVFYDKKIEFSCSREVFDLFNNFKKDISG